MIQQNLATLIIYDLHRGDKTALKKAVKGRESNDITIDLILKLVLNYYGSDDNINLAPEETWISKFFPYSGYDTEDNDIEERKIEFTPKQIIQNDDGIDETIICEAQTVSVVIDCT